MRPLSSTNVPLVHPDSVRKSPGRTPRRGAPHVLDAAATVLALQFRVISITAAADSFSPTAEIVEPSHSMAEDE
jgi:hypothetical protein